ncbi:DNA adenine methylase [Pseudomonas aeruginosa]|uniref:DNA adenine methylase n=1 Tax=Pseudomonas aeruginosa TaxID=287 RepID=UPI0005BC52FD|nr:DNA adenine methylase [Pseudomonas aeruginosa]KAA5628713.1 DNA adenine methylase [Pseudomonas aeruginosa]KAA5641978.1 DNA adenine methylase [Pseudomonas aeruginosa]KSE08831.1 DNA methyltransferase [Pseudomonas aeruginosa]MBG6487108.1 DNA adenine methylase [Pseudomonas aeruginosa]MBV5980264.1 DNA adenine methylase [Pseudomonas aeruginosa]
MYSNRLYTPLRYPGGKARFAPFIAKVMELNGLTGGHYLEPYAGGAGVALELLFHEHASHIHINDLDPAVNAFWVAVTQHADDLLRLLHDTPIDMDQWHYWRGVMLDQHEAAPAERGFATLFVNRTNRSGILKGGVIGGKDQTGPYKLDARFKKDALSARISKIAERASSISVYCEDARDLLLRCEEFLPKKSLIYLDPPYYVKGRGLYRNYYDHFDHLAIAKVIKPRKFNRPWMVSYDNAKEIRDMYQGKEGLTYGLSYSAQERYLGDEVMFFQSGMKIPDEAELPPTSLTA